MSAKSSIKNLSFHSEMKTRVRKTFSRYIVKSKMFCSVGSNLTDIVYFAPKALFYVNFCFERLAAILRWSEKEREKRRFFGKHKSAANCKLWKMQLMALRRLGESWKLKISTNAVKDAAHTLGGILAAGTESLHWRGARGGAGGR